MISSVGREGLEGLWYDSEVQSQCQDLSLVRSEGSTAVVPHDFLGLDPTRTYYSKAY